MTDVGSRYARIFRRGEGTDRLQAFSDGVFAIALTLLVLDLQLPQDADGDLLGALLGLWPQFFAFVLSFVIIAINWHSHHAKFRAISQFDTRLIWLNFLVLFIVAFVPFPTSVLSEHPEAPAVVLYAATVAALSLAQLVLWLYAYRAGLVKPEVDAEISAYVVLHIIPTPIVFLGSIPIALFDARAAMWTWFALFPVSILLGRLSGRRPRRRSRDSASAAER